MLKEFRERQGLTQEKLSEITNIDRKTIFRIEGDLSSPLIDNYAKIVVALKMTNEQIAENIREIAKNQYKKKINAPYDEENCIYYISNNYCAKEDDENEIKNYTCCICRDKVLLEEGEEIEINERYILKREKGKLIKKTIFKEESKENTNIMKTNKINKKNDN